MKSFLSLLMLLLIVISNVTLAQPLQEESLKKAFKPPSGKQFINLCKAPNDRARESCGGVIISLINAQIEMAGINRTEQFICPPRRLTVEEGRLIFLYWVESTPKAQEIDFPEIAMRALHNRYFCVDDSNVTNVERDKEQ